MIGAIPPAAQLASLLMQTQQPEQPFTWGRGGRRMTPEDIAREREIAAGQMQADYSPVGHWLQGAARLADNVSGAFRERRADKAAQENMDYNTQLAQLLSDPTGLPSGSAPADGSPPPPSAGNLAQILSDPYASRDIKALAGSQLENQQRMAMKREEWANREPPEVIRLSRIAHDPNAPEWERKDAADRVTVLNDPLAVVSDLGGGLGGYVGPRSQLEEVLRRQMGGAPQVDVPPPGTIVDDPRKKGGQSASPAGTF